MIFSEMGSMTTPLNVTPEGWVQILTTLCFPQTELPPSSGSKSELHISYSCCCIVLERLFKVFVLCRYAVAESDCNLAIALDSNYFKAYARRGAARFALKKYESALEGEEKNSAVCFNVSALMTVTMCFWTDYEMVLKLDPGNVEAQNEMKKIKEVSTEIIMNLFNVSSLGFC